MSDSESENDLFPNNVLTFQNHGTIISAKGPNINTNISSLSFRNNVTNSTLNLPRNLDRPRYAESVCASWNLDRRPRYAESAFDQRSVKSSSRSMYNGRSGSPMSVRSVDSTRSARDIAFAFENMSFNKFDLKLIRDAYNKHLKGRVRKRIEKRRNIRKFLKGYRRKSGSDSGNQASDSSNSSDDCQSMKSSQSVYKENMTSCRPAKTGLSYFRNTLKESTVIRDRTNNFKQNSFKSMTFTGAHSIIENPCTKPQTRPAPQKGFLLPSQRFNQSVASMSGLEKSKLQNITENRLLDMRSAVANHNTSLVQRNETDSEEEEIFNEVSMIENSSRNNKRKRIINPVENSPGSDQKRRKTSPQRNNLKPTPNSKQSVKSVQNDNDFVFAKPQLPIRKPGVVKNIHEMNRPAKNQQKSASTEFGKNLNSYQLENKKTIEEVIASSKQCEEKLLAMSKQCEENTIIGSSKQLADKCNFQSSKPNLQVPADRIPPSNLQENEQRFETSQQSTDLSMRPSFIKRKLFTQKVDDTEKNSSGDNLQVDSPQTNIYSKIQKDKNKARKLVTSQSCLTRDILADENNLLELIHQIVPPDRMNVTTATNRSEVVAKNKSKPANVDKWDITSVLSTCNDDELSGTYTDDEIFDAKEQEKISKCVVLLEPVTLKNKTNQPTNNKEPKNFKVLQAIDNKVKNKKMSTDMKNNAKHPKGQVSEKGPASIENKTKNNKGPIDVAGKTRKEPTVNQINKNLKVPGATLDAVKDQPMTVEKIDKKNDVTKGNIYKCVKSFWDNDSESDFDFTPHKNVGALKLNVPAVNTSAKMTHSNLPPIVKPAEKTQRIAATVQKKINTVINSTITEKTKINVTNTTINKVNEKQNVSNAKNQDIAKKNGKNSKTDMNTNCQTSKSTVNTNQKNLISQIGSKKLTKTNLKVNSNTTINNTKSKLNNTMNSTMRIRPQRNPKVKTCCKIPDKLELGQTMNDTLYMKLRSRQVHVSPNGTANDNKNITVNKKTTARTKKLTETIAVTSKVNINLENDISLTFTPPPAKRRLHSMVKKTSVNVRNLKPNDSDVSFTLKTDKTLNSTTRSSRRNKEIESLQISSSLFFRPSKRSPLNKKSQSESLAVNRSTRLNRSRMR